MAEDSFRDFVVDQLRRLGPVQARAMFGGHGLYHEDLFFGIIHAGRLYFKTDSNTRATYVKQGMGPFQPNERQTLKSYYEVPVDVLEDDEALAVWARRAVEVAAAGTVESPKERTES